MPEDQSRFRGNPRHLAILFDAVERGDISIWNRLYRTNGPAFKPNLAGADLSGLALGEIRLDGADLSGGRLSGTILARSNLNGACFRDSVLTGADLRGAKTRGTDFRNADLRHADLSGGLGRGADLSGAKLDGASLPPTDSVKHRGYVRKTGPATIRVVATASPGHDDGVSPWKRALDEENRMKDERKIQEERQEADRKDMLDRKLGRRKPLFRRVK